MTFNLINLSEFDDDLNKVFEVTGVKVEGFLYERSMTLISYHVQPCHELPVRKITLCSSKHATSMWIEFDLWPQNSSMQHVYDCIVCRL